MRVFFCGKEKELLHRTKKIRYHHFAFILPPSMMTRMMNELSTDSPCNGDDRWPIDSILIKRLICCIGKTGAQRFFFCFASAVLPFHWGPLNCVPVRVLRDMTNDISPLETCNADGFPGTFDPLRVRRRSATGAVFCAAAFKDGELREVPAGLMKNETSSVKAARHGFGTSSLASRALQLYEDGNHHQPHPLRKLQDAGAIF